MTISVTSDRLQELFHCCAALVHADHVSHHDLQSLLGVMSFVTPAFTPPKFSCPPFCTLSTFTNHLACAHCLPLINLMFAGGAISYLTTMVCPSSRFLLGSMTIFSSLLMPVVPVLEAILMDCISTPLFLMLFFTTSDNHSCPQTLGSPSLWPVHHFPM